MDGYSVRVDRHLFLDTLTGKQQAHPSEVELDAVPVDKWSYNLVGVEGQIDKLKADAVAMFDDIVQKLTFPDMDKILAMAGGAAT